MDGGNRFLFNIGDKVVIAIDPAYIENHVYGYNPYMQAAVGEVHTIRDRFEYGQYNAYRLSNNEYTWDERVLEHASVMEPVDLESIGALL